MGVLILCFGGVSYRAQKIFPRKSQVGETMKKDIHPKYVECTVHCGCGETWQTRSTVPQIKIEICSQCHPFYQGGDRKFVDTLGRVDRFTKKFGGEYFKKSASGRSKKART